MKDLISGYRRFRGSAWPEHRGRFQSLAESGQRPRIAIIACADSRVDPQMIFAAAPGELFVIRNVANLVPPYTLNADYHGTSASLEFAVRVLGVAQIIVMGHGRCGGIAALLAPPADGVGDFIGPWMSIAAEARVRALARAPEGSAEALHACEHEAIKISLANLLTFPWIRMPVATGALALHGCHFDIHTGELLILGRDGDFHAVAPLETGQAT